MDTITETVVTETPTTDIVTSDEAVMADSSTDSFGKEVTKTILVSIATTAVLTGGTFAASYAVEKFKQYRHHRLEKKIEKAVRVIEDNITQMKTQEAPDKKD